MNTPSCLLPELAMKGVIEMDSTKAHLKGQGLLEVHLGLAKTTQRINAQKCTKGWNLECFSGWAFPLHTSVVLLCKVRGRPWCFFKSESSSVAKVDGRRIGWGRGAESLKTLLNIETRIWDGQLPGFECQLQYRPTVQPHIGHQDPQASVTPSAKWGWSMAGASCKAPGT